MINANTHAIVVLYSIERVAHFQLLSFLMAIRVAIQGKYSNMNTKNDRADAWLKPPLETSFDDKSFSLNSSPSSSAYNTPNVLTTISFAGTPERTATEDDFLERVIATIKEKLAKANPLGGLLQLVQTPPAQIPTEKENKAETEETVMDFMDNF